MTLLQILVVLAVVAAVAAVAAGVLRGGASDEVGLPEATASVPALRLSPDRLGEHDLGNLRFSIGFRGYRMDEVDQVLDRLAGELRARDAEVAELRVRLEGPQQTEVDEAAALQPAALQPAAPRPAALQLDAAQPDAAQPTAPQPGDKEGVQVAPHLGTVTQDVEEF